MKKQKKFMTGVLGAIAVYLAVITATADVTKGIGVDSKKQSLQEITQEVETETSLDCSSQEQDSKTDTENVETITDDTVDNSTEEVSNNVVYGYTNKQKSSVFTNPNDGKVMDTLIKATRVEVLEEKEFENKKQTKVKKQDGTFEIKITTQIINWTKIKYKKNLEEKEGWIKTENLNEGMHDLISKDMATVDFSPVKKLNYPDNPKRTDVRGIYLTIYSVSSDKKLDELIALTKRTPINSFVI